MRKITMRTNGGPGDPEVYWRRRFFILGGGLTVLMVLAWLFGGGSGPGKQQSHTAAVQASVAARQAQGALPSAAYGGPYGARPSASGSGSPSPSASGSASPSASGTPSPSRSASGSASASASGKASASPSPKASRTSGAKGKSGAAKRCPAGSVVLTVVTSRSAYRSGEQPKFSVYAVSTSASGCQLKYGPGAVRVVVTRHGKVVWNSAACKAARRGARTVRLAQGVPQEVALSWNRKSGSCAGTRSHGSSGTFEAVASADGFTSPSRSFKLLS
ncbi:MAG: hypothetical protein J2P26_10150 [Nocardiopsaceae bacterium]|nr:hypothetical protein [Nocardiopsaceae bacterium]